MTDDNVNWAQLLDYLIILYHHVLLVWLSLYKYKILVGCEGWDQGSSLQKSALHIYTLKLC